MAIENFGNSGINGDGGPGGGGQSGGRGAYRGIFADQAALNNITDPEEGWSATNTATNTLWYYDGVAWANTGSANGGDMLAALYDPTGRNTDAFNTDNHVNGQNTRVFSLQNQTKLGGLENHWRGDVADATERDALTSQLNGNQVYQEDTSSVWTRVAGVWQEGGGSAPLSRHIRNEATAEVNIIQEDETLVVIVAVEGVPHIEMTVDPNTDSFTIIDPNRFLSAAYHVRVRFGPGDSIMLRNPGDHVFVSKDLNDNWTYINYRTGLGGSI